MNDTFKDTVSSIFESSRDKKSIKISEELQGLLDNNKLLDYHDLLLGHKNTFDRWSFHYNLAVYYYKEKNYTKAKYHLLKSEKFGPRLQDSQKMMERIDIKLFYPELEVSMDGIGNLLFNTNILDVSLIVMLACAFILINYRKLKIKGKDAFRICWYQSLMAFAFGGLLYYFQFQYRPAVVLKDDLIYSGPSKIFKPTGKIHAGQKIVIKKHLSAFYYVYRPKSLQGWLKKDTAGILPK